jgi:hypothetical protein
MVKHIFDDGSEIYLDGFLKEKLDNIKMIIKKNWDAVFIIVGDEGSGKSTLAFICAQYLLDNKLTINNIAEGSTDAMEKLKSLPNGSLLICDEAELLFSSRETMSAEQKKLTQIMKVIRQKNMILILVTPVFFDLAKYITVDRARFLIRCYTDHNLNRGYFAYWGKKKKLKLFMEGKKHYGSYMKPKAQFFGRFTNYIPPFNDEYMKLKERSLDEAFKGKEKKNIKDISDTQMMYKLFYMGFTPETVAKHMNKDLSAVNRRYYEWKSDQKAKE